MPEPEVEYAVRLEWGEVMPRPSLALAQGSVEAIRARGGVAALLSRTVVRSEWAEVDTPSQVERELAAGLARSLGVAVAVFQPGAELVVCLHETAKRRTVAAFTAPGESSIVSTAFCPVCKNYAEALKGEPELGPVVLNAVRCSEACAEQHTYRGGCQLAVETREGGSDA